MFVFFYFIHLFSVFGNINNGDVMEYKSIWNVGINYKPSQNINQNFDIDVLIVGGGITGMSVGYHLLDSELSVCIIDSNFIGSGVTSKTTGKLTYLQDNIYQFLDKKNIKKYLRSQIEAINCVCNIVKQHKIDCDLQTVKSYLFSEDIENILKIDELLSVHIKTNLSDKLPDSKKCSCICVDDTYIFHPLKYLYSLKKIMSGRISFFENSRLYSIKKFDEGYICSVNEYFVKAKKIVIASHYPYFTFPLFLPLKSNLEKSYLFAFRVSKTHNFSAISCNEDVLSIRYYKDDFKIILKNSSVLPLNINNDLNFNIDCDYAWSNKDIITIDKLPYIGELKDNMYIGCGYNTWGMTNGSMAGIIISDLIKGVNNDYIKLFDPRRAIQANKIKDIGFNCSVSFLAFLRTKFNINKQWYKNVVFKKINGDEVGIYTDDSIHIVHNKCPHMGCNLLFNNYEKTWDCPCHGSRFDIDGKSIEGPSNYDISYKN